MKKLRYLIALFLMMCIPQMGHAQEYPLDVTVTAKPKFTPILGDFLDNPAKYININVRGGGTQQDVYFLFKIEQVAPAGNASIATKAGWRPKQPIMVRATGTTLVNSTQISQHFADVSTNDINTVGVEVDDYQNYATASTRIPEGVYNLCVYACDFNAPMGSLKPLSNPQAGCTTIKICYKADAPRWIAPSHYSVRDRSRITPDRFIVKPKANIRFQWTAPSTTCGISPSNTTYQLRLVELLEGQTLNDAASNNPPVLVQDNLRMTFYNLDTIRYPNLLERGKNYAAQIVATSNDKILRIQNRGRSKVIHFVYKDSEGKGKKVELDRFRKKTKEVADNNDAAVGGQKSSTIADSGGQKSSTTEDSGGQESATIADSGGQKSSTTEETDLHAISTATDCEIDLPTDQKAITSLKVNDEVTIGKFTMTISKINSSNDGVYSGEGSVKANLWENNEYYTMNAFYVKVKFKDIKVNKDKKVFAGSARAMYSANSGLNTSADFSNKYVAKGYNFLKKKLGKKIDGAVKELDVDGIGNFTGAAKAISAFSLETSQTLPLNLKLSNEITEGHGIDTGVSDMFFTPTGAMFSMYLFVKIPEANTLLAFGASDLCMYDNPFKNGKLALMANIDIPLGTDDYKLIIEGDNKSNEPSKTYVKWTTKGYDGMQLSGRLELPKSQIKNVADPSKPASFDFTISCQDWGDWMANLSMNGGDKFEFVDLEGYHFKIQEAVYDHSKKENPEGLDTAISKLKPLGYKGNANEFKGLYLKRLEAEMPKWITDKGEDAGRVVFALTDAFFDKYGFSMNIGAENILDVRTGNLGGWGISIDQIGIQLIQSTLQQGNMKGKFEMPILGKTENDKGDKEKGYINYDCIIKRGEPDSEDKGKMTYAFRVTPPKNGLSYEFLKYFDAKIKDGSKISVEVKEDKGAKLEASFNGELNVTVDEKIRFTAISFEGLRIANFDKKNKPGFDFDFGVWAIGNGKGLDLTGDKSDTSVSLLDQGHVGGGARLADPELLKWIDEYNEAVTKRAEGNYNVNKGFKVGPFGASLDEINFEFKDGDAKNFNGKENAKNITLKFKTTLSLDDFGEENSEGKEMAAVTTSIGFDIPIGYNMPTTNIDEFFNLEMPEVDFENIDVHFNEITIRGEFGPVKMYGSAMIFDKHETYGDGFRGAVSVVFPADIKAYAAVQFGEVGENSDLVKYWYVDAGVTFGDVGLEVGGGTFAINGFGGGVWKNMERSGNVEKGKYKKIDESKKEELEGEEGEEGKGEARITDAEKEAMKEVGNAPSGLTYKPVKSGNSAFGFYARLDYCASKAAGGVNTFHGSAELNMDLKNGEFNEVSLNGDIHVLSKGSGSDGMVNADVAIKYNHPNQLFNLDLYVKGNWGAGDFRAPLSIRADGGNKKYYLALGEPEYTEDGKCNEDTNIVCLNLLNFKSDIAYGYLGAQAYVCGGNDIPYVGLPELPQEIKGLLQGDISQYRKDPKAVKSSGLMMGARVKGKFGFEFGILYANLEALAGFDVALTKLEKEMTCAGGGKLEGFGGYYARGQVYAYLHGDTGVQLKIFGFEEKFSLLNIEAGALLQGGFKDPSWVKGSAKIRGSVLNGAISFDAQARFKIGHQCEIEQDPLKELVVIEAISPGVEDESEAKKEEAASVMTWPKIVTNVKMNSTIGLASSYSTENFHKRYYKFVIDKVTVENLSDSREGTMTVDQGIGKGIITKEKWFENYIEFTKMLKEHSLYKVSVKVKIKEYRKRISGDPSGPNRGWYLPRNNDKPYTEKEATRTKVVYFKTGKLSDRIVEGNIVQGYPYQDQVEAFIRDRSGTPIMGYFDLAVDQGYLLKGKKQQDMFVEFENKPFKLKIKHYFSYKPISIGDRNFYRIEYPLKGLKPNFIYKATFYVKNTEEKAAKFKRKSQNITIKGGENNEDNSAFGIQDNHIDKESRGNNNNKYESLLGMQHTAGRQSREREDVKSMLQTSGRVHSYESPKKVIKWRKKRNSITSVTNMVDKISGKKSSDKDDATTLKKASVERYKQIMTEKGQKLTYKNIFEFYFHVSGYYSPKQKMEKIKFEPTFVSREGYVLTRMFTVKSRGSHTSDNSRDYGDMKNRYLKMTLPNMTTAEEIYPYKSWHANNSVAVQIPSHFRILPILKEVWNDKSYVKSYWKKMLRPIKLMYNHSSEFSVPCVNDIYIPSGNFDKMVQTALIKSNLRVRQRLSSTDKLQAVLHDSGHCPSSVLYFVYQHHFAVTNQLMMVGNFSKKYGGKGSFLMNFERGTRRTDAGAVSFEKNSGVVKIWNQIRGLPIPNSEHGISFSEYYKRLVEDHRPWTKRLYKRVFKIHNHKIEVYYENNMFRNPNKKPLFTKEIIVPSDF